MTKKKAPEKKKDADEIIWPNVTFIDDLTLTYAVATAKLLNSLGKAISWYDWYKGVGPEKTRLPCGFKIEGLIVEFRLDWFRYYVDDILFDLPKTAQNVLDTAKAVKTLRGFGFAYHDR